MGYSNECPNLLVPSFQSLLAPRLVRQVRQTKETSRETGGVLMTTWHCDKCSLRFGTYADFGDHWRTDHRKDPITERIVSAWQDTPRPDDFTSLPLDKRLHCTRCDFTDVLTGDWFTDGGTMIQHMEDAHTPHAVEGIVQPNSASSGAALQVYVKGGKK